MFFRYRLTKLAGVKNTGRILLPLSRVPGRSFYREDSSEQLDLDNYFASKPGLLGASYLDEEANEINTLLFPDSNPDRMEPENENKKESYFSRTGEEDYSWAAKEAGEAVSRAENAPDISFAETITKLPDSEEKTETAGEFPGGVQNETTGDLSGRANRSYPFKASGANGSTPVASYIQHPLTSSNAPASNSSVERFKKVSRSYQVLNKPFFRTLPGPARLNNRETALKPFFAKINYVQNVRENINASSEKLITGPTFGLDKGNLARGKKLPGSGSARSVTQLPVKLTTYSNNEFEAEPWEIPGGRVLPDLFSGSGSKEMQNSTLVNNPSLSTIPFTGTYSYKPRRALKPAKNLVLPVDSFTRLKTGFGKLFSNESRSDAGAEGAVSLQASGFVVLANNAPSSLERGYARGNLETSKPGEEHVVDSPAVAVWPVLGKLAELESNTTAPGTAVFSGPLRVIKRLPHKEFRLAMASFRQLPGLGAGEALPSPLRRKMEETLGKDFSSIRVYSSPLVENLGAEAFTSGNRIVFAPGRYNPATRQGLALLGHELSHAGQLLGFKQSAPVESETDSQEEQAARQQENEIEHIIEQGWPAAGSNMEFGRNGRKGPGSLNYEQSSGPNEGFFYRKRAGAVQNREKEDRLLETPMVRGGIGVVGSFEDAVGGNTNQTLPVAQFGPVEGALSPGQPAGNPPGTAPAAPSPAQPSNAELELLARQVYSLLKARLRSEQERHRIYSR